MSTPHTRPGDYYARCEVTKKRGYATRKQARKARQAGGHRHGHPYKCRHCNLYHLGHYKAAKTRDEYRRSQRGQVHIHSAAKELGISLNALLLALNHMGIVPENNHIPASVLHQLKQLTYR